jgi:hypothetical protein
MMYDVPGMMYDVRCMMYNVQYDVWCMVHGTVDYFRVVISSSICQLPVHRVEAELTRRK